MKKTTITIRVTKSDIIYGVPENPFRCMNARAINRALKRKGDTTVYVYPHHSGGYVGANDAGCCFLPKEANQAALIFDSFGDDIKGLARLRKIKPFSFELNEFTLTR